MSLLLRWKFLLSSTAQVLSNEASATEKAIANASRWIFGDRIQVCDATADNVEFQAAIDDLPA